MGEESWGWRGEQKTDLMYCDDMGLHLVTHSISSLLALENGDSVERLLRYHHGIRLHPIHMFCTRRARSIIHFIRSLCIRSLAKAHDASYSRPTLESNLLQFNTAPQCWCAACPPCTPRSCASALPFLNVPSGLRCITHTHIHTFISQPLS